MNCTWYISTMVIVYVDMLNTVIFIIGYPKLCTQPLIDDFVRILIVLVCMLYMSMCTREEA